MTIIVYLQSFRLILQVYGKKYHGKDILQDIILGSGQIQLKKLKKLINKLKRNIAKVKKQEGEKGKKQKRNDNFSVNKIINNHYFLVFVSEFNISYPISIPFNFEIVSLINKIYLIKIKVTKVPYILIKTI